MPQMRGSGRSQRRLRGRDPSGNCPGELQSDLNGTIARTALEELHGRSFRFSWLSGWLFFDGNEFVTELPGLAVEFLLVSLLTLCISLRPEGGVVLDLVLHHGVEDGRDFLGGCGGCSFRPQFTFHAAEVVSHGRLVVMERVGRQPE